MKVCTKCKLEKPLSEFYNHKKGKHGKRPRCKPCSEEDKKEYYEKNRSKVNKKAYEWQKSQPPEKKLKIAESRRERQHRYQAKRTANEAARRARKMSATPPWLSDDQLSEIASLYWLAKDLKAVTGYEYHVDHILPLQGKNVCGLHVPWNLQVLPSDINLSKSNTHYKDY